MPIKFPDFESWYEIFANTDLPCELYEKYNAEIIRLNTPIKPEFPEYFKYCTKDKSNMWYIWSVEPEYSKSIWCNKIPKSEYEMISDFDIIIWLEHVNAGRPPENSLIKLEEYL